jgi:hypothetical protein
VSATINGSTGAWQVTFDRPLLSMSLTASQWREAYAGQRYAAATAVAAGSQVSGTRGAWQAVDGNVRITYTNSTNELRGSDGQIVAGFFQVATVV